MLYFSKTTKMAEQLLTGDTSDWGLEVDSELPLDEGNSSPRQSWKKPHAAHAVHADIFSQIKDNLVKKSRTYAAVEHWCCDFDLFSGEY
jgi:hypothetical protein